jgi:hypothetical protein
MARLFVVNVDIVLDIHCQLNEYGPGGI